MTPFLQALESVFAALPLPLLEVWGRFGYYLGAVLMVVAYGGFTLRTGGRWKLGRERQAWDRKAFLSIPLTFLLIIGAGYVGSFIVLVPGAQTFESLKDLVVFVCVVLFGYPALLAVPFAYGLSDLVEGVPPSFLLDWLPGYFINPACFWVAYQLLGRNPDFRLARTWRDYGAFVVFFMATEPALWGYVCADKFTAEISYRTITPALFFTTGVTWLLAPVAMLGALPLARRFGFFWAEIPGHVKELPLGRAAWPSTSEPEEKSDATQAGVPIRMLIVAPFIVLVLVMVGVTAYVTLRSAAKDSERLAARLHEEIAGNINLQLDDQLVRSTGLDERARDAAITRLLQHLPISTHGRAFIVDRSGRIVASSAPEGDAVTTRAIADLQKVPGNSSGLAVGRSFQFVYLTAKPLSRETWLARATAYRHAGVGATDWLVVTAMPESYYLAGVRTGNSRTAMILALALLLSLAVAAVLAAVMTAPLRRISTAIHALAQGNLTQKLPDSSLEEIGFLARSFNRMAAQLKKTFDDLGSEAEMRRNAEVQVRRLNRTYAMLSEIHQLIVRRCQQQEIFARACQIAVERGGFRLAWIGLIDPFTGRLGLVAQGGASNDTLEALSRVFGDPAVGCAFTADALRTGESAFCNDIAGDPKATPWRDLALERGYRAVISLPLVESGRAIGTFNLYATDAGFFDAEEIRLLNELAADISFAREFMLREAERLAAEAALRSSEERFRELAGTIDEVFWVHDPERNQILYVSPAYERIWGLTCQSLHDAPLSWLDAVQDDDRARIERAIAAQSQEAHTEEFRIARADGETRWIRARVFPVRDAGGRVLRTIGVAHDITDRRSLEEQFLRAQRMEAIGALAGGLAHDLNNILAPMLMAAEMLKDRLRSERDQRIISMIETGAQRGSGIIRQLLTFSRGLDGKRGPVQVSHLLRDVAHIIEETFPRNITLERNAPAELWTVIADPTQLHQVLLNLCVNARDAMPRGGRLSLTVENVDLGAERGNPNLQNKQGRHLKLTVADTGDGIAPQVIDRIFDPFFTTKPIGKGTGLGLPSVLGIVKSHGGFLTVDSELGKGTTFKVYLPADDQACDPDSPGETGRLPHGQGEMILLVDDEAAMQDVLREMLEVHDYRVALARNGEEAVRLFLQHRDAIKLVLTDVDMPVMGGPELIRSLRVLDDKIRVVAMTGSMQRERLEEMTELRLIDILEKPCEPARLLRALHGALNPVPS